MEKSRNFGGLVLVFMVLLALIGNSIALPVGSEFKEPEELSGARAKFVVMPSSLMRFLFYNSHPNERLATNGLLGYKRSSSALDALTGVTLGKRASGAPMEFLNMEPYYGRQFGLRTLPRMYDMRWAPLDSYDTQVASQLAQAELN